MRDMSDLLNNCFDQEDHGAPVRAFVFGAVIAAIAATASSLAIDPRDVRMLGGLLAGAIFLGGGCSAMFAYPPDKFGRLCSISFRLVAFVPMKLILGIGLLPGVFVAFSFFVATVAAIAALHVLYVVFCSAVRWLHSALRPRRHAR